VTPDELRERRKRLGLTQAQLAALLGQDQRVVSRWEVAKSLPAPRSVWLDQEMARVEREHTRPRGRPKTKRKTGRPAPEPSAPADGGREGEA
jgi:DNA-binding XRE family transcriptional regulator